mgnify:CR=1 FL=1
MLALLIAFLLSGCIVAVEDSYCVSEAVDEIVLDVSNGDVTISTASELCVVVDVGGLSTSEVGHEIKDGVLYLDYDCSACGGEIQVAAPRAVLIDVAMGTGDLQISDRGGDVFAAVGAGEIDAIDLASARTELASGAGSVKATWLERPQLVSVAVAAGSIDITVPAGVYFLDLQTKVGSIDVSGIEESNSADSQIAAVTSTGAIHIRGK